MNAFELGFEDSDALTIEGLGVRERTFQTDGGRVTDFAECLRNDPHTLSRIKKLPPIPEVRWSKWNAARLATSSSTSIHVAIRAARAELILQKGLVNNAKRGKKLPATAQYPFPETAANTIATVAKRRPGKTSKSTSNHNFTALRVLLLFSICHLFFLVSPPKANAGASILGFSIGDDTITLGAILTQAIQQVKILGDLAEITREVKADIAFVRDVYETGNDIVNGRWDVIANELLGDVLASDESLREIIRNTEQIVTNRVPRGDRFRRLVASGFEHVVFEAFGPYPFGRDADIAGLADLQALNLNNIADDQMRSWREEHRAIQHAVRECASTRSFEVCNSAANRMQIQSTHHLEQLKAIEAHRAKAEATKMAQENGEKKEHVISAQKDITDLMEAVHGIGVGGAK